MRRLRRSDCRSPGIVRRRSGKSFSYYWPDGRPVRETDVLERIRSLAIPPAWQDVWICSWPHGHIQAVGTDSAGRRQYRYHDKWREMRDRQKFDRVLDFAQSLSHLRDKVDQDLASEGLSQARVLACAVRLLDLGFFRIGGEEYAEEHETFGVSTLLKRHVQLGPATMTFDYPAKGSLRRIITLADPACFEVVSALKARRGAGPQLFAYKDAGKWRSLHSEAVNAYIRDAAGPYSAKDFRTWSATVLAAVELAGFAGASTSVTARARLVSKAVKAVSCYLGNTPAVCRRSYIDPTVIDRFLDGETIAPKLSSIGATADFTARATREAIEAAVIDLIGPAHDSAKRQAA